MRYNAFISYRHAELDLYIAKKIHKALETFKVPKAVAKKTGKKNIKRVFRDQEELPIGSDLSDNIENALRESEYLLVICSPRTPQSYWVQKEIETFIGMHGRDKVLAVLIEGEPDESFPSLLLSDDEGNPVEPLAADVRGISKRETNRKLKTEVMRLAAPLLGCTYDDLKQRHRERKMKRLAAIAAVVTAGALAFGAYSTYNAALIRQNLEGKQRNQSKYLADTSLTLLEEGDRRAAVLVALEALPSEENDRPYVAEAQYALSQALYSYDTGNIMKMDRVLSHDLPVTDFYFSQDGEYAASIDQSGTVYAWEVKTGQKLAQIAPKTDEYGYLDRPIAAIIYDDSLVICEDEELKAISFDEEIIWSVARSSGTIWCEFDETAKMAACVCNEEVVIYDITNGKVIAELPNNLELSYSSVMAYSDDKNKFAISHINTEEDATAGYISVYDFETGEITDVETKASYISDMVFTADNCIVVAQTMYSDVMNLDNEVGQGFVQKLDWRENSELWIDTYEYKLVGYETASSKVKYRCYEDLVTGDIHDEVVFSVDNTVHAWDGKSGEKITQAEVSNGITNLLISINSGNTYLAQSNGIIEIINMSTGVKYGGASIETGKEIKDLSIRNGKILFRSYASPELTVMKYPQEAQVTELEENDCNIASVTASKEETYYAVDFYDFDVGKRLRFYRAADHKLIYEWIDEKNALVEGFIDDSVYVIAHSDGNIIFNDLETGESETLFLETDFMSFKYDESENKAYLLACSGYQFFIVDLQKREIISSQETEDFIRSAIISNDGKYAYCNIEDKGVNIVDMETGELTPLGEEYIVLNGFEAQELFKSSNNGELLAVSCGDGMLRVFDTKKKETIAEIPFTGINRRFIQFSADDLEIMLQGDDYYFKVYSLEEEKFTYIALNQYYEIEKAVTDEKTGTISLVTLADMLILNADSYEMTARVEDGKIYLPKHGVILSGYYGTLYQFPYMTLEMLKQEAIEQFGLERLTEAERIKYRVQ